eukprot:CAMPEP_0177683546 /NCGR_PEP_ID=MMETSP0447-20121125/31861_1 /TAXON_ID=0 /ORGANISM="Stygamoeba regulata, Strain BSH-02190019" /LENGTH=102 /DNA_ID=CAMNT_0019193145 /DNA_START=78 /DNA_END=383 /DNA_ORIENTATION=+
MVSSRSLDHVATQWFSQVSHIKPDTPVVLVGLKTDLMEDKETLNRSQPVTPDQVKKINRRVGAHGFVQCSALTGDGIGSVLEFAVRTALGEHGKQKKTGRCS